MSTKGEVEVGIPKVGGKVKWQMSKQWERLTHESFKLMQNRSFQIVVAVLGLSTFIGLIMIYASTRRPTSKKTAADMPSIKG